MSTTIQCQTVIDGTEAGNVCRAVQNVLSVDLSSQSASIHVGHDALSEVVSTTINTGVVQRVIQAGNHLTPAEYIALSQVVSGGSQTLLLDSAGRAVGGTFFTSLIGNREISSLIIPAEVTAISDNTQNSLDVTGALSTAGMLLGLSVNSGSGVNIQAGTVNVAPGGSITTILPDKLLALVTQTAEVVNLTLISNSDIINAGTIAASGILSLDAAGSIINQLPAASPVSSPIPIIAGNEGTNLFAGSGTFSNAGIISSAGGSVNFTTTVGRDLVLNNISGQVLAGLHNINLGNQQFSGKNLSSLSGGRLMANSINIYGGDGEVRVAVDILDGALSITGGSADVSVSGGTLNIGNMALSGDPFITNSGGDINLLDFASGKFPSLSFPGDQLTIIASGNVTANGLTSIDLSNSSGDGGHLHIIAGFDFARKKFGVQGELPFGFFGPSDQGGNIDLTGVNILTNAPLGNGGNVTLAASQGAVNQSTGNITLGPQIDTHTELKGGRAGNVVILASNSVQGGAYSTVVDLSSQFQNPLSSQTGFGGSLDVIAGYEFSLPLSTTPLIDRIVFFPTGAGFPGAEDPVFTIGNPSTNGGDVSLLNLDVDTGAVDQGLGGAVSLVAHDGGGGNGTGQIILGSIRTTSINSESGSLNIIAPADLTFGTVGGPKNASPKTITTEGAIGGNIAMTASRPTIVGGTIGFNNGTREGTGQFAGTGGNSGGSLELHGNIFAKGFSTGIGGAVTLTADNDVELNGRIITTGVVDINSGITVQINGDISSFKSINIQADHQSIIGAGISIRAGFLIDFFIPLPHPDGILLNEEIGSPGSVQVISGGSIFIESLTDQQTFLESIDGNIRLEARGGDIFLGGGESLSPPGGLRLNANGGSIFILASGVVKGIGVGNSLQAVAVGTRQSFSGGGIEIGALFTPQEFVDKSLIENYLTKRFPGFTTLDPANVLKTHPVDAQNLVHNDSGLFQFVTTDGNLIDVSGAAITIQGGALVFRDTHFTPPVIDLAGWSFGVFAPPLILSPLPATDSSPINLAQQPQLVAISEAGNKTTLRSNALVATDTVPVMDTEAAAMPACSDAGLMTSVKAQPQSGNTHWLVSGGDCQPYSFDEDQDMVIVAAHGSIFAPNGNRTIILQAGHLVCMSGKNPVYIDTNYGRISLPPQTTVLLDKQNASGIVRMACLNGGSPEFVLIGVTTTLSTRPGEEVVIAGASADDKELVPADIVERKAIRKRFRVETGDRSTIWINQYEFELQKIAEQEKLLMCGVDCLPNPVKKRWKKMVSVISEGILPSPVAIVPALDLNTQCSIRRKAQNTVSDESVNETDLEPVSCIHPATSPGQDPLSIKSINTSTASIKSSEPIQVVIEKSGSVYLGEGEALISSSKNTKVKVGAHWILLAPGSVVLICNHRGTLTVRGLYEKRAYSVRIFARDNSLKLAAGQEILLGDEHLVLESLKRDRLGRRRIKKLQLSKDQEMVRCDISLVTLFSNSRILANVVRSNNSSDRAISSKLMKMTACLNHVTRKHGRYSHFSHSK